MENIIAFVPEATSRAIVGLPLSMEDADNFMEMDDAVDTDDEQLILNSSNNPAFILYDAFEKQRTRPNNPTMCSSCGDAAKTIYYCTSPGCNLGVCVEKSGHQFACIFSDSLLVRADQFKCPRCHHKLREPQPYEIQNHTANYLVQQTTASPLALYCLVYAKRTQTFPVQSIIRHLQEEYTMAPALLEVVAVRMKAGASKIQKIAKVQKALLKQMRVQEGHGKYLLFMDTHSDYETGWVAYATRKLDGAQLVQPASEVIARYMGKALVEEVKGSKGLKGLVLMTCGSAFTKDEHFESVKGMVASELFSFVIGFTGISVVPRIVMLAILQFVKLVFMYEDDIWDSLVSSFLDHRLLTHTPVVLIYRNQQGEILSRQIVYSVPQARPWGLQLRCGVAHCPALPGSFHIRGGRKQHENHPHFLVKCLVCGWTSEYVPRPPWLMELPKKFFFWSHYPLAKEERMYFLFETKRIREGLEAGMEEEESVEIDG